MPVLLTSSGGSGNSRGDMLKHLKGRKRVLVCIDPIRNSVRGIEDKNTTDDFDELRNMGDVFREVNDYISQAMGDIDLISKEAGVKEMTIVEVENSAAYHTGGISQQQLRDWLGGPDVGDEMELCYEPEKVSDAVMAELASKCDTIYVTGGKPNFDLVSPFWNVIKDRVKTGELLYIGRSCGSIVAGNWQHAKADPACKDGRAGLGLVNAVVVPHATSEGENANAPRDKGKHIRIKDGEAEFLP